MTKLSKRADHRQSEVLRSITLQFLNQEWNVFVDKDWCVLISKDTKNPSWECCRHCSWINIGTVEEVAQVEDGCGEELLVGKNSWQLNQFDQFCKQCLGWVPHRSERLGNHC